MRISDWSSDVCSSDLNQESSFFRDTQVVEMVADAAARFGRDNPGRRVRLWSAGCSTGQEPLSLAMLFSEQAGDEAPVQPEIVATDVSDAALTRAREGRSEEHTSELQSLMRISYAALCVKKKTISTTNN